MKMAKKIKKCPLCKGTKSYVHYDSEEGMFVKVLCDNCRGKQK